VLSSAALDLGDETALSILKDIRLPMRIYKCILHVCCAKCHGIMIVLLLRALVLRLQTSLSGFSLFFFFFLLYWGLS
jgi:hypothetical protein